MPLRRRLEWLDLAALDRSCGPARDPVLFGNCAMSASVIAGSAFAPSAHERIDGSPAAFAALAIS
jgi:hypothetical protein